MEKNLWNKPCRSSAKQGAFESSRTRALLTHHAGARPIRDLLHQGDFSLGTLGILPLVDDRRRILTAVGCACPFVHSTHIAWKSSLIIIIMASEKLSLSLQRSHHQDSWKLKDCRQLGRTKSSAEFQHHINHLKRICFLWHDEVSDYTWCLIEWLRQNGQGII